jgi:Protein of unknown function (DUF1266)
MRTFARSLIFVLAAVSISVVPALAQQETGTVVNESLDVYARMSGDSDVVATLKRGTTVRILLTISDGEHAWCSIADLDTGAKLGYALCSALSRQGAPSTAATGVGRVLPTLSFSAQASSQPPTRAQKAWAIAAAAILSTYNRESTSGMSSGLGRVETRRILADGWNVHSHDDLTGAFAWLDQGGNRVEFSDVGARAESLSPEKLKEAVSHLNAVDASSVRVAYANYERFGTKSISAWDYARYINLCRWGVDAGYLSEDEAWQRTMYAARILQQTFGSWREFGENYMVGSEFYPRHYLLNRQRMQAVHQELVSNPSSPWNRIPWSLPLN